jgi:hypothetical protein
MFDKEDKTESAHEYLTESEKKSLLSKSEISLILDKYEDIFSSFDPRPYTQRSLSVDFLDEAKRASKDKEFHGIELKILMPKKKRNKKDEIVIKRRLHEHFRRHFELVNDEVRNLRRKGFLFVFAGIIMMVLAAFVSMNLNSSFAANLVLILLEPGGWFFFWEGLYFVLIDPRSKESDLHFYKKMSNCTIEFLSY